MTMRNAIIGVVAGVVLAAAPGTASAQAKQGDKEVLVGGNLFAINSTVSTTTQGQFNFGVGYFLTDRFELNVNPVLSITSGSAAGFGSSTSADLGLASSVQYFFGARTSRVKPYIGGTAIIESFKTQDSFDPFTGRSSGGSLVDNLFTGGTFGVKNYFTDRAALDFKASYGFNPTHAGDFRLLQVNVGITYLF
jgi:outer membrane protein W